MLLQKQSQVRQVSQLLLNTFIKISIMSKKKYNLISLEKHYKTCPTENTL